GEIVDVHAEAQTKIGQFPLHFAKAGLAEAANFEQVGVGLLHQVADVLNLGRLEAVVGPNRQIQILDRHVELGLNLRIDQRSIRVAQSSERIVAGRVGAELEI